MMLWIEFDLIFAFFYILHTGDLHCVLYIVLDFISTFFCMQAITMVFWTVLDLIFTFFHNPHAFLGEDSRSWT